MATTRRQSQSHLNASDFFTSLIGKAKKIAEDEADKISMDMQMRLRLRFPLEGSGNGRYPKWDPARTPNPRKYPKSAESFKNWKRQKRANGEWWLVNMSGDVEGYNYVSNLISGKHWNYKTIAAVFAGGGQTKNLVQDGPLIFSKQMPRGLGPWLIDRRELFETRVKNRMLKEL